jgi:acetylornithine deacetylase/succinyl-diaminopimelate desuccinylase-like protein
MEKPMEQFIQNNLTLQIKTLEELCAIPAPSHMEQKRAAYCKKWLESVGAEGVYIDDALNVVFPINCDGSDRITVFVAHTDTVFPDTAPMPYHDDGTNICCPGVGDDTASLVQLLLTAKYFVENRLAPKHGVMFVCNSCEEGLGNLKGTRQLFADFAGRIGQFISFDSQLDLICDRCAGSHRYQVRVETDGGHSFQKFGTPNAIAELSKIVTQIYSIEVPNKPGVRTTYNVGNITGGTSVNTVAQNAEMLCEYRSEDKDCLAYMEKEFEKIFAAAASDSVRIFVKKIGDRPCSDIEDGRLDYLRSTLKNLIEDVIQSPVKLHSASTDCNIPLSLGIPAICIGVYRGGASHTRQEWIEKASLPIGLEVAIRAAMACTQ